MWRLLLAALLLATPVAAHEFEAGGLRIGHPYAIETAATAQTGAGYFTVTNTGDASDRLVAVEAEFPRVMIHTTETDASGVARMIEQDGLEIAPGETLELSPGGTHVMFMGLGEPFEEGETVPATLVFERAGRVEVEFNVEPRMGAAGADAPGHDHH
jgi:copper(I)-binding protein